MLRTAPLFTPFGMLVWWLTFWRAATRPPAESLAPRPTVIIAAEAPPPDVPAKRARSRRKPK